MKKLQNNKLGYLSLFSLIGFFGIFTEYNSFMWFFGYIGYAYYFTVVPDELFEANLRKASTITLLIVLLLSSATIIIGTFSEDYGVFLTGLSLSFLIGNLGFATIHTIYEARESSGAKNEDI